nr:CCA tRNA nucleotidyltransferase [Paenibacillus paridis]
MAAALPIIERLREHHFEAVFVGGAVRDTVLGLSIKDVDIATSARPEQVLELFERCIPTGLQHGTITVLHEGETYEVTTFRLESAYEAHRKPESVEYITELDGDLLRRDFTMNAMALGLDGELHDPYGGVQDLKKRRLRSVGDSNARFQEDALRMLRAVRFIGIYQLRPAHHTWRAVLQHRHLMGFIALERVQVELDKLLAGAVPQRGLRFVAASGLLFHLKESLGPDIELAMKEAGQSALSTRLFERLHELADLDLRWAFIAITLNQPAETASYALQVLRFPNGRSKRIAAVVQMHFDMLSSIKLSHGRELQKQWVKLVLASGNAAARDWLQVARAAQVESSSFSKELLNDLERWLNEITILSLKQLSVSGRDLMKHLQREAGPWVSECLNRLLFLAAIGVLENEKQALLQEAAKQQ